MLGTHLPACLCTELPPATTRHLAGSSGSSTASMDSPLATQLFRQLFSHRAARCLARPNQCRAMASRSPRLAGETKRESRWTPRQNAFPNERMEEFDRYPMVTADMLKMRRERPRRVKMLLRDFIDGQCKPLCTQWLSTCTDSACRQSIQSQLRLLLKASRHLLTRRPLQLQQDEIRGRLLPAAADTLHRF
jgi:hypothetical protein